MNDQTVTLTLSVNEVNAVLAGLGQLPLAQVLEVFTRIKSEAEKQLNPAPQVPAGE